MPRVRMVESTVDRVCARCGGTMRAGSWIVRDTRKKKTLGVLHYHVRGKCPKVTVTDGDSRDGNRV